MANNSAYSNKVLNETANKRQEDRKQHSTDELILLKAVDSGKHCSVISSKNFSRVSYAEILKQPIRKPQSCDSFYSHDTAECDLTQIDQSYLEALQLLGDPSILTLVLSPGD